ncbi:MAG: transposase [Duodenibacillus sp.]|nr:transposase [Duodenibacillus sp.]
MSSQKITPDMVKGIPEGAKILNNKYVYFGYAFRKNGKPTQERDYLGTVNENLEFVPNDYYLRVRPIKGDRPLENWNDPVMRARLTKEKEEENCASVDLDVPAGKEVTASVGVTALAASILYDNGMIADVGNAVFGGDAKRTMHAINLAIHYAISSKPTYLARPEAEIQKFIGTGCLSSPRASEFHMSIGRMGGASKALSSARAKNICSSDLLALDGTRIRCQSKNIKDAAPGKSKEGDIVKQINFSMMVNAKTGEPVGYRYFAGNVPDVSTLQDFRAVWEDVGIADKQATMLLDRGYFSQSELISLHRAGLRYIVGAKTSLKEIRSIINEKNDRFSSALCLVGKSGCYGVQEPMRLRDGRRSSSADAYVFHDPQKAIRCIEALKDELDEFSSKFNPKIHGEDPRLVFFETCEDGKTLKLNEQYFEHHCYELGFFAFVSNCGHSKEEALERYAMRNEVECLFKLMFENMTKTTRVHSSLALEGLMFTTFIGLGLMSQLRTLLKLPDGNGKPLKSTYTISELLKTLQPITIVRDKNGRARLINVTEKHRRLVEALGYKGLFDSADAVWNLLSARHLADHLSRSQRKR